MKEVCICTRPKALRHMEKQLKAGGILKLGQCTLYSLTHVTQITVLAP
jgi:hypothetical protein